jgi:hypothetical protein
MRRTPLLGLLVALALLSSACSGTKQPSTSELRTKVATQLRDQDHHLTKAQADCYAKLIVAKVGTKTINKVTITDKEPEAKVKRALAASAIEATRSCHVPASTTTSTSTTASTATTTTTAP